MSRSHCRGRRTRHQITARKHTRPCQRHDSFNITSLLFCGSMPSCPRSPIPVPWKSSGLGSHLIRLQLEATHYRLILQRIDEVHQGAAIIFSWVFILTAAGSSAHGAPTALCHVSCPKLQARRDCCFLRHAVLCRKATGFPAIITINLPFMW